MPKFNVLNACGNIVVVFKIDIGVLFAITISPLGYNHLDNSITLEYCIIWCHSEYDVLYQNTNDFLSFSEIPGHACKKDCDCNNHEECLDFHCVCVPGFKKNMSGVCKGKIKLR